MNSLVLLRHTTLASLPNPAHLSRPPQLPPSRLRQIQQRLLPAALKSPRGFGPAPQKIRKNRKRENRPDANEDEEEDGSEYEDDSGGTIPEVVTNRMIRRMGVSIGMPLALGLLFFPLFYYLKVVAKVDVPSWIPFLFSFFFGASLMGISYGIVSASWDPLREGSFLGWTEAQRNWPVFWHSLRGKKQILVPLVRKSKSLALWTISA